MSIKKPYDYLVVGSGLFGSVFAREATDRGKKCLVIDKRSHTGGNIHCKNINGINVHQYGPHIFHTNDDELWEYVNRFTSFNRFTYSPLANYKGRLFNLPFNMNTFYQMWGVTTPEAAKAKIEEQIAESGIKEPANLEEQAIKLVGRDIYELLIKGYTEKQWGRKATELPAFIIKRLPVRFTFDNNYFNDRYQGIPIGGYNTLTDALLKGIEVKTGVDYFSDRSYWHEQAERIVFTGKIDEYFGFEAGYLEYRSLSFDTKELETGNFQGNAGVNYTDAETPYTRIIEHKHFEFGQQPTTVITYEYPEKWTKGKESYYPVNDDANNKLFKLYRTKADGEKQVIFGGRLAEYRYYDMHQVIASALNSVKIEFGEKKIL